LRGVFGEFGGAPLAASSPSQKPSFLREAAFVDRLLWAESGHCTSTQATGESTVAIRKNLNRSKDSAGVSTTECSCRRCRSRSRRRRSWDTAHPARRQRRLRHAPTTWTRRWPRTSWVGGRSIAGPSTASLNRPSKWKGESTSGRRH